MKIMCHRLCIFTGWRKAIPFIVIEIKRFEVCLKFLSRSLDWKPNIGRILSDCLDIRAKDIVLRFGKEAPSIQGHFLDDCSDFIFESVLFGIRVDGEEYATTKLFSLTITACKLYESSTKIVGL